MSSLKRSLPWETPPAPRPMTLAGRRLAAGLLTAASASLARIAAALEPAPTSTARVSVDPQLEYHAEAGAPEGALYVDGELVGWLRGVQRL
jgi:hypothetical protein